MCSADQHACRSLGSSLVSCIVFSAAAPFSPTSLFQFCTTDVAGKPRYSWVGHALDLDKELFEAEFWRMLPADELRLPTTLTILGGYYWRYDYDFEVRGDRGDTITYAIDLCRWQDAARAEMP